MQQASVNGAVLMDAATVLAREVASVRILQAITPKGTTTALRTHATSWRLLVLELPFVRKSLTKAGISPGAPTRASISNSKIILAPASLAAEIFIRVTTSGQTAQFTRLDQLTIEIHYVAYTTAPQLFRKCLRRHRHMQCD